MAAARQAALAGVALAGVAFTTLFVASHWAEPATTPARALEEIAARAGWADGPLHYRGPFEWVPMGIDAILAVALLSVAYVVFRPLAHPRDFPGAAARRLAATIVREHGRDTLSAFKLRADTAAFADLARGAGLRSFYIGDEALIDTRAFSLEGRAIRKVRQAVRRIEREGYSADLVEAGELDAATLGALEQLVDEWRGEDIERGFSMASVTLLDEHMTDSFLLVARAADGTRGSCSSCAATAARQSRWD